MNWKDVLYVELQSALLAESSGIARKNIRRRSEIFTPPPRRAAPPSHFGLPRNSLPLVTRIVDRASRATLASLTLSEDYADFCALSANESYFVYQTVGAFHNRLVDRTRALLRRLCLAVTVEARNHPPGRPVYSTSLGLRSDRARTQMRIALNRIINGHTNRGEKPLPNGVLEKIGAASTYGDVVAAVLPLYTSALRR